MQKISIRQLVLSLEEASTFDIFNQLICDGKTAEIRHNRIKNVDLFHIYSNGWQGNTISFTNQKQEL